MIENEKIPPLEETKNVSNKKKKKKKETLSNLANTFFKNALRSNLDLTSLADTKAGILISLNGFILTVSVTASGFAIHNPIMTYAFISIILTSLGSIILAVMAVRPRSKNRLVKKEYLEGYNSLLYYQDMADLAPTKYSDAMNKVLYSSKKSKEQIISHLHILGAEIKKKYFWLRQAYTFFSIGLIISATLMIYALVYVKETAFYNLSKGNVIYKKDNFYNIFEPSGIATMPDGKTLIAEDEGKSHILKLVEIETDGNILEVGDLYLPKKEKKYFKKSIEDLEAITAVNSTVYAITSHSLTKEHKRKAAREQFIMFTYEDGAMHDFHAYKSLRDDLEKNFPKIFNPANFAYDSLDIEGLSINSDNSTIFIGFRSPTYNSNAMIIGITNPKKVFLEQEKPKFTKPIFLDLNGLAIRDITYDAQKKGYWIIAGDSTQRNTSFKLWFWDKTNSKLSIVKNQPDIGYGEGITIINKGTKNPALFIVEDNGQKPNKSADFIMINRNTL